MTPCPVCAAAAQRLDSVPFNKACMGDAQRWLEPTDRQIEYWLCEACGHCFAPEMMAWPPATFRELVYNDAYCLVDPEYQWVRSRDLALRLREGFGCEKPARHLDYGGGNGTLARLLREAGWDSHSYDPYVSPSVILGELGKFSFVTCFEVFEHAPDPHDLMGTLARLLAPGGLISFTTLLSDGEIAAGQALTWWYAAPRNGHINLFSAASLGALCKAHGLHLWTTGPGAHVALVDQTAPKGKT